MSARLPYTFSILKYVHDSLSGEFVNIGVAMFSAEGNFLRFKCRSTTGRVTAMFPSVKHNSFKNLLEPIKSRFSLLEANSSANLKLWKRFESLDEVLNETVPKDDSSLVWSALSFGASNNLEAAFEKIFIRHVSKFDQKIVRSQKSDDDVWRVFRKDLEKRNLLEFFERKSISVRDDEVEFPFAWKNGIWHCVDPISFDLTAPDSIKDKAHRWLGQITSVMNSSDKFKVYLVVAKPQQAELASAFDKAIRILEKSPVPKEIYIEGEIDTLMDKLSSQVAAHSQH